MIDHTNVSYGLQYGKVYSENDLLLYILNCCFAATPRHFATPDKLSRFRSLRGRKCHQILDRMVRGEYVKKVDGGYVRTSPDPTKVNFAGPDGNWHICTRDEYPQLYAQLFSQTDEGKREERIAALERQIATLKEKS